MPPGASRQRQGFVLVGPRWSRASTAPSSPLNSYSRVRMPIAATHPPFAATMTVRRGRPSRSTFPYRDLRGHSSLARPAVRIAGLAVVPCQGQRARCDSPRSQGYRLRRGHVMEGKSAVFGRKHRDPELFKALAHGLLRRKPHPPRYCTAARADCNARFRRAGSRRQPRQQPPYLRVIPTTGPGHGGDAALIERCRDAP
jgi:hypothetical protein